MTSWPDPDPSPAEPPAPLVARTVAIDDPGALLSLVPRVAPTDVVSWVRGGSGLVGWGRTLTFEGRATTGSSRPRSGGATSWPTRSCATTSACPARDRSRSGRSPSPPQSASGAALVVPEVLVGRRGGRWWLTTIGVGAHLPGRVDPTPQEAPPAPAQVAFADGALSGAEWSGAVAAAVARIGDGDLDKVVLARDLVVDADADIDPRWLLQRLAERYGNTWVFAVDGLVGATPELLVRLEKGLVTSRVLAGTIRRTGDDAHDLALAASLARSSKDLEEHEYAVRSVAEALAPHCSSMNVPEAPFVLHLSNVMHLATDVAGVLTDDVTSLALAASLHPSAAVCGTPTDVAAAAIADLEHMDRARYAGPVGWMDGAGDGEWGIALRCGAFDAQDPRRMRLFAGCGIVAGSVPEAELAESDAKFVPMRDALTAGG